ncbi:MAG: MBL fold metallo-hydrolase [Christensenellales bacterium]
MKIVTLGSGSKGNCTVVATEGTTILIDAGLPITEIETKLVSLNINPMQIDAILVTHEHSDHIKALTVLAKNMAQKFMLTKRNGLP